MLRLRRRWIDRRSLAGEVSVREASGLRVGPQEINLQNISSYNASISALKKNKQWAQILQLVEDMRVKRCMYARSIHLQCCHQRT